MLPHYIMNSLVGQVRAATTAFAEYTFNSHIHRLEARFTIFRLEKILRGLDVSENLREFLKQRAFRIENTNIHYLHDFSNPANIACIEVAKILAKIEDDNYLSIVIPKLTDVPPKDYLTSSYVSKDLNLQECILNDEGNRLINILDVYNFACNDGVLKNNSILNGKKTIYISENEANRIMSRHPTVQKAFDASQNLVQFKLFGNSVGAALERLIEGLREGNAQHRGVELDAGSTALAAIVNFFEFFNALSQEKQRAVLNCHVMGEWHVFERTRIWHNLETYLTNLRGNVILKEPVGQLLPRLSGQQTEYWLPFFEVPVRVNDSSEPQDIAYCVKIISDRIQDILKDNQILYEIMPDDQEIQQNLNLLQHEKDNTCLKMVEAIPSIVRHYCFGEESENKLLLFLIQDVQAEMQNFDLEYGDIFEFIKWYYKNYKNEELVTAVTIAEELLKFISQTYTKEALQEILSSLSQEERECYLQLTAFVPDYRGLNTNSMFNSGNVFDNGADREDYKRRRMGP